MDLLFEQDSLKISRLSNRITKINFFEPVIIKQPLLLITPDLAGSKVTNLNPVIFLKPVFRN